MDIRWRTLFRVCTKWKEKGDGFENDFDIGTNNDDDLKPGDMGLIFSTGLEYGPLGADLFWQVGLSNVSPYLDDTDARGYNSVLGLSLFYKLGSAQ